MGHGAVREVGVERDQEACGALVQAVGQQLLTFLFGGEGLVDHRSAEQFLCGGGDAGGGGKFFDGLAVLGDAAAKVAEGRQQQLVDAVSAVAVPCP
ncbi:MAG TPA: hypothetical protein VGG05_06210 [Pseudonocardiaceae bacterium]